MKNIKNVLKYIASLFLVLLVSLCVYTFIVTDILKKDYVNVFGYSYFVIGSSSMSGTLEVDDIIFVKLTKDVKKNDIITYKNKNGEIITHRLIEKSGSNYVTKGDVNNVSDEAITKSQIIGKVKHSVSPSFVLKSIAIFLIVFILLALVNFDNIIKKYIVKDNNDNSKLPDDIFRDPKKKYEEPSSGMTVSIPIEDVEKMEEIHEKEVEKAAHEEEIEVLDFDEFLTDKSKAVKKVSREKETVDLIITILKSKNNSIAKAKMNKKWLTKYQYVYKLAHLLLYNNVDGLVNEISKPPFKEIYDYDLDKAGLTETIRDKIYEMPIYVFLRLLTYCILYNDDEMFDGIYKILKYKVMIDKDNNFRQVSKLDNNAIKQIKTLIAFMKKISNKYDNKNVFDLDKIERMVKIENY